MLSLHIDLDPSHPEYGWLEKQADKIGVSGHFLEKQPQFILIDSWML